MSDDTPTRRFDQPGADAPTERFNQPPVPPAEGGAALPAEGDGKPRRLLVTLLSIGGAVLLAVVILLVVLLTRSTGDAGKPSPTPTVSSSATSSATPTKSATPTPSPAPTASPTAAPPPPPPPSNSPKINAFSGTNEIFCNTKAPVTPSYELSFTWSTSNASAVYFGVGTTDAETGALLDNLPANGNSASDFPYPVSFPCPQPSQIFTLTVVGNGEKVSKTITVTNIGDTK